MIPKRLAHYEILAPIGRGGMGEVLRARDTRLGREVAIKTLPEEFARHPERVARLRLEAQVLASLHHPRIALIYGVEEVDGLPFLVMELVPGEPLVDSLARGPLAVETALKVSEQIAEALEEAHGKGVVHRDLKPGNVLVDAGGNVKVLDFGLAKVLEEDEEGDPSVRVTLPGASTQDGVVLGTPAYMSPEQARGDPVDGRTDLWALGCVLFEMLSGTQAFQGKTHAHVLTSILVGKPDWERLPEATPPGIRRLLLSLLAKEPDARVSGARDVQDEIRRAIARLGDSSPARSAPRLFQLTYSESIEESPAWSPDGAELLFMRQLGAVRKVFRLHVESGESFQVTHGPHDDCHPAWHPTEARVLFVRARLSGRKLQPGDVFGEYGSDSAGDTWELDMTTGAERLLVENGYNPAYAPDGGRIALDASWAGPRRIWIVDRQGRNPQQATSDASEAVTHVRPRWSPDGKKIVFQNVERTQFDVRTVDLTTRSMQWLTRDLVLDVHPVWDPSGDFVYFTSYRSGGMNLWRVPVDETGASDGPLRQVTSGAGQDVEAAVSADKKRLAFCILRQNADLWRLPVSPTTGLCTGEPEAVVTSTREASRGAWSPDDDALAFNSNRTGDMNLWLFRFADRSVQKLTEGAGGDYQPNWSPDGRRLTFFSSRNGNPGVWVIDAHTGAMNSLSPKDRIELNPFFSPDGKRIAFQSDRDGRLEVWSMNADGSDPRQLTQVGVMGHFLRWSRDGRWIHFRRQSGNQLIHRVRAVGGDPEPLTGAQGGSHLSLSPDGSRIMDVLGHQELWVSDIESGSATKVFRFEDPDVRIDYPVWSHDGKWVLFDRFRPKGGDIWMMENPA